MTDQIQQLQTEIDAIKQHAQQAGVDLDGPESDIKSAYLKLIRDREKVIAYMQDTVQEHINRLQGEIFPPEPEPDTDIAVEPDWSKEQNLPPEIPDEDATA